MNHRQRLQQILAPGWQALKLFWLPFCIIQSLSVALVASYYYIPSIATVLGHIAAWKAQGGFLFSALSVGVAGAIVPELFKLITRTGAPWTFSRFSFLCYTFVYFMISGVIIDLFYRGQGLLFGTGNEVSTVVYKVLLDMNVFTPGWAHPFAITWFLFRRTHYNLRLTFSALGWPLYRDQVVPVLLPGWAFWYPMVGCIYSLPSELQVPLFLFALSAWSLVFMFVASDRHETSPEAA